MLALMTSNTAVDCLNSFEVMILMLHNLPNANLKFLGTIYYYTKLCPSMNDSSFPFQSSSCPSTLDNISAMKRRTTSGNNVVVNFKVTLISSLVYCPPDRRHTICSYIY